MSKETLHQIVQDIEKDLLKIRAEIRDSYREFDWRINSLQSKAERLEKSLDEVERQLIPPSEYKLLKSILFGAVGLILVGVISAWIAKVIVQ